MVASSKIIHFLHMSKVPSKHKLPSTPHSHKKSFGNLFISQLNSCLIKIYPSVIFFWGWWLVGGGGLGCLTRNSRCEKKILFDLISFISLFNKTLTPKWTYGTYRNYTSKLVSLVKRTSSIIFISCHWYLIPWRLQTIRGFLVFSGSIERDQ